MTQILQLLTAPVADPPRSSGRRSRPLQQPTYKGKSEEVENKIFKSLPYQRKQLQLRHLERYPLRTSYVDIAHHVSELLKRDELHPWEQGENTFHTAQTHPTLIVDSTGVGAPVTDLFKQRGVKFVAVTITGGTSETHLGTRHYGVPKPYH